MVRSSRNSSLQESPVVPVASGEAPRGRMGYLGCANVGVANSAVGIECASPRWSSPGTIGSQALNKILFYRFVSCEGGLR